MHSLLLIVNCCCFQFFLQDTKSSNGTFIKSNGRLAKRSMHSLLLIVNCCCFQFFLQDTKSSNGTFINNQRLSKGSEESPPRELFSGDIVQFGVDVMENSRKGNSLESYSLHKHFCFSPRSGHYYFYRKQHCTLPILGKTGFQFF